MGLFDRGRLYYSYAKHFLLSFLNPQIHVDFSEMEFGVVGWPEVT